MAKRADADLDVIAIWALWSCARVERRRRTRRAGVTRAAHVLDARRPDGRACMMGGTRHLPAGVTMLAVLSCLVPYPVRATQKFGPIQVSGNLQTANIARTPDLGTFQYIMNRNTAHLRLDYDWLQSGKFYGKYDIPFIESSHLSVVWRGVYDSIYDTTPGFIQKEDLHGHAYAGNLTLDQYRRQRGFPSSVL